MKLKIESKGQIITLDVLLALIPITLIIGYSALSFDEISVQLQNFILDFSGQGLSEDVTEVLIKTPGIPPNWNVVGTPKTVGLAYYNTTSNKTTEHFLDYDKIASLTESQVTSLLSGNFNLAIVDIDSGKTIKSLGSAPPAKGDIFVIRRVSAYQFGKVVVGFGAVVRVEGQPVTVSSTFVADLTKYDYWLLISYSKYIVGTNPVDVDFTPSGESRRYIGPQDFPVKNLVNSFLRSGSNNVNTKVTGRPGNEIAFYILQIPKGTDSELVNATYVGPRKCILTLQYWR